MPAKITFAGENTYKIYISISGGSFEAYISPSVETYQADALSKGGRKRAQDVHSWVQPLCQSLVVAASLVEFSNLILKHGKDGASRVACLQLGGKWMCDKVFLGLLFIRFQGSIENGLEA